MKYGLKTAVRILSEYDRENVIDFLKSLGGVNTKINFKTEDVEIGEIWFIKQYEVIGDHIVFKSNEDLSDYTILNGVPKDWREEMNNINTEVADQYQGLFNLMSKEYGLTLTISEMDEIVSESLKLTELEKVKLENEKLRECLKGFIDHSGYNKYTKKYYLHNYEFSEIITQAKQLLTQLEK